MPYLIDIIIYAHKSKTLNYFSESNIYSQIRVKNKEIGSHFISTSTNDIIFDKKATNINV